MPIFKSKDSCQIYYDCDDFYSDKPLVVFLNGTTQTTRTWWLQAQRLRHNFRVLLYDARGQGQSDLGGESLSLDVHAGDLLGLLDHLGETHVHLIGLSHGARIACRFTELAPERTDRVIICGLGKHPSPRTYALLESWIHILNTSGLEPMVWSMLPLVFGEPYLKKNKTMLNKMVSAIVKRNRADAIKSHLKAMIDYLPVLDSGVEVYPPALIVTGDQDLLVPIDRSRALAQKLGAHLVKLKGVGHSLNIEAPEAFNQIILQFLLENM